MNIDCLVFASLFTLLSLAVIFTVTYRVAKIIYLYICIYKTEKKGEAMQKALDEARKVVKK